MERLTDAELDYLNEQHWYNSGDMLLVRRCVAELREARRHLAAGDEGGNAVTPESLERLRALQRHLHENRERSPLAYVRTGHMADDIAAVLAEYERLSKFKEFVGREEPAALQIAKSLAWNEAIETAAKDADERANRQRHSNEGLDEFAIRTREANVIVDRIRRLKREGT